MCRGDDMQLKLNNSEAKKLEVFHYPTTDSTNNRAKDFAYGSGSESEAVFIADEQTAGRGRAGKVFESQKDVGIYISLLIRDKKRLLDGVKLTVIMAVALRRTVEKLCGFTPKIKWVNDLVADDDRKLSGILCEGKLDSAGALEYAVLGVGVNLYRRTFSENLLDIASSLEDVSGVRVDREEFAGALIDSFFDIDSYDSIIDEYRHSSSLINREINVITSHGSYRARVLDINRDGELVVVTESGERKALCSAEVSTSVLR